MIAGPPGETIPRRERLGTPLLAGAVLRSGFLSRLLSGSLLPSAIAFLFVFLFVLATLFDLFLIFFAR